MKKIAIIGAGQAGLYLGLSSIDAGYSVTIYSDRTPDELLKSRIPATPTLFPDALALEKKIDLNFWDENFLGCHKYFNKICDSQGNINLNISADLEQPWKAIDPRLKLSVWMEEFTRRAGNLVVRKITIEDLEKCYQKYDLVVVSVGKGDLARLFERDEQKSKYQKPQRHVAVMLTELEPMYWDAFEVINLAGVGEIVQYPLFDREGILVRGISIEAIPNGPIDVFSRVRNARELLTVIQGIIKKFVPWNYEYIRDAEAIDDSSWLCGAITPKVRKPVGRLESGGVVMGIGDVVILNDPIAAQGANNAIKMADLVARRIIERGQESFDEFWMQQVFDEFWEYSQYVNLLSDFLLSPGDTVQSISRAMAENPEFTKDVLNGFNHPPSLYPWYFDPEAAREYLERKKIAVYC